MDLFTPALANAAFVGSFWFWALIALGLALIGFVIFICVFIFRLRHGMNINTFGFAYDPEQDLYFSEMDAWQRHYGFTRAYDEAAGPMNMILHCEPVYFEYGGKNWLLEFWKGQYGALTGAEVGLYSTSKKVTHIGKFNSTFYRDTDLLLDMSISLVKDDRILFSRRENHWWLTGFKLGMFSEPEELTASIGITFLDLEMRNAFIKALMGAGYSEREFKVEGLRVLVDFTAPHTPQPSTSRAKINKAIQKKNKLVCDGIAQALRDMVPGSDKMEYLRQHDPKLYGKIVSSSRSKALYLRSPEQRGR